MIHAYGSSVAATTNYRYDGDGNVALQNNPKGTGIASSYNADGYLMAATWDAC
jgi:YD repeat-containing protein